MANSKAISIRVHDELLDKIDKLAEEKYKSRKGTPNRSQVVLDALDAYFDTLSDNNNSEDIVSLSDTVRIEDFQELRNIVNTLSDSVRQLEDKVITLSENDGQFNSKDIEPTKDEPEQNQLSIISVSDSVQELTGQELAKKLGINASDISTKKNHLAVKEFIEWTKNLPTNVDRVGWTYKPKDKGKGVLYYPVS
jgi:predicted DNA-binding protein